MVTLVNGTVGSTNVGAGITEASDPSFRNVLTGVKQNKSSEPAKIATVTAKADTAKTIISPSEKAPTNTARSYKDGPLKLVTGTTLEGIKNKQTSKEASVPANLSQSTAETRATEAKAAKAKADSETTGIGSNPIQAAGDWMKHVGKAEITAIGRTANALKDQAGDTFNAAKSFVTTGDTTQAGQLAGKGLYRAQTTISRSLRDFSNGPDRANQTTGADTAAKSAKLETSVKSGDVAQAKTDAAELEKTTNSLPEGEAKDHLREKTDKLQDNMVLGNGTAAQTTNLASDTTKISKGITSNVTNVNMNINKLAASNAQGHGAEEIKTNFDNLSTRVSQMPEGEVKQNMKRVLTKMDTSVRSGNSTNIADSISELRSLSTSAEATANDTLQQTHKIVSGETLTQIMADKSVDASQLATVMKMNGMTSTNLTPGKTVILPARDIPA